MRAIGKVSKLCAILTVCLLVPSAVNGYNAYYATMYADTYWDDWNDSYNAYAGHD